MNIYFKFPNINRLFVRLFDGTEFEVNSKDEMVNLANNLSRYLNLYYLVPLIYEASNFKIIKTRLFNSNFE